VNNKRAHDTARTFRKGRTRDVHQKECYFQQRSPPLLALPHLSDRKVSENVGPDVKTKEDATHNTPLMRASEPQGQAFKARPGHLISEMAYSLPSFTSTVVYSLLLVLWLNWVASAGLVTRHWPV
jgi:hypothetical protein